MAEYDSQRLAGIPPLADLNSQSASSPASAAARIYSKVGGKWLTMLKLLPFMGDYSLLVNFHFKVKS